MRDQPSGDEAARMAIRDIPRKWRMPTPRIVTAPAATRTTKARISAYSVAVMPHSCERRRFSSPAQYFTRASCSSSRRPSGLFALNRCQSIVGRSWPSDKQHVAGAEYSRNDDTRPVCGPAWSDSPRRPAARLLIAFAHEGGGRALLRFANAFLRERAPLGVFCKSKAHVLRPAPAPTSRRFGRDGDVKTGPKAFTAQSAAQSGEGGVCPRHHPCCVPGSALPERCCEPKNGLSAGISGFN